MQKQSHSAATAYSYNTANYFNNDDGGGLSSASGSFFGGVVLGVIRECSCAAFELQNNNDRLWWKLHKILEMSRVCVDCYYAC